MQAGRLKGYAVSSASRSRELENVRTLRESGVDSVGESWFAMFAPAATPQPVVSLLRNTVAKILRDPDFSARIERDGGRVLAIAPAEQAKSVTRYGVGVD